MIHQPGIHSILGRLSHPPLCENGLVPLHNTADGNLVIVSHEVACIFMHIVCSCLTAAKWRSHMKGMNALCRGELSHKDCPWLAAFSARNLGWGNHWLCPALGGSDAWLLGDSERCWYQGPPSHLIGVWGEYYGDFRSSPKWPPIAVFWATILPWFIIITFKSSSFIYSESLGDLSFNTVEIDAKMLLRQRSHFTSLWDMFISFSFHLLQSDSDKM